MVLWSKEWISLELDISHRSLINCLKVVAMVGSEYAEHSPFSAVYLNERDDV